MKVHLLRLMVRLLAASMAKNWSRWSRYSAAVLLLILLSSKKVKRNFTSLCLYIFDLLSFGNLSSIPEAKAHEQVLKQSKGSDDGSLGDVSRG
jgi:hypothetical protein